MNDSIIPLVNAIGLSVEAIKQVKIKYSIESIKFKSLYMWKKNKD